MVKTFLKAGGNAGSQKSSAGTDPPDCKNNTTKALPAGAVKMADPFIAPTQPDFRSLLCSTLTGAQYFRFVGITYSATF